MYYTVVIASLLLLATSFVSAQVQPSAQALAENDIHVLQYALILENLEYAFYTQGQRKFTANDFVNAGLTSNDYTYFNLIQSHEEAHVGFLNATVPSPTTSCTYNFNINTVAQYIALAQVLENTGVSAYDGALNNFYSPALAEYAATIATIEARHASYLNRINAQNPFPAAFDTALNASTVADIVFGGSSPLATCQFAAGFALPKLLIVIPVANASDANQPTSSQLADNDVKVLQYALFLEHLEAAFYDYVVKNFTAASFPEGVYNYITMIGAHEKTHVDTLTSVISAFATPIADCTYNFSGIIGTNPNVAIATAAALEETGVTAYDGAAKSIYNSFFKQVAATIVTVEARHASYINYVVVNTTGSGQGPVQGSNGAFDFAYNYSTVAGIVLGTKLIVNCPAGLPQEFQTLIVKPYTNATVTSPTSAPTSAPTPAPTGTPTSAPTPTSTPAPTGTPTNAPTTGPTTTPTTTPTVTPTPSATTRGASTTARTSGASIAYASVVVAMLVAVAAL